MAALLPAPLWLSTWILKSKTKGWQCEYFVWSVKNSFLNCASVVNTKQNPPQKVTNCCFKIQHECVGRFIDRILGQGGHDFTCLLVCWQDFMNSTEEIWWVSGRKTIFLAFFKATKSSFLLIVESRSSNPDFYLKEAVFNDPEMRLDNIFFFYILFWCCLYVNISSFTHWSQDQNKGEAASWMSEVC